MPATIAAGVVKGHMGGHSCLLVMVIPSASVNPEKDLPSITQIRKGCCTEISLDQQMLVSKPPVSLSALTDGINCMSGNIRSGIS